MGKHWSELREELVHAVNMRGVQDVANAIPANRTTVYRLIRGDTTKPHAAIQQGVERVVRDVRTDEQEAKP